ncbi:hypothetical protein MRX96_017573 [Rhipicephalus microplus]
MLRDRTPGVGRVSNTRQRSESLGRFAKAPETSWPLYDFLVVALPWRLLDHLELLHRGFIHCVLGLPRSSQIAATVAEARVCPLSLCSYSNVASYILISYPMFLKGAPCLPGCNVDQTLKWLHDFLFRLAAEYFQISDLTVSYTPSEPHLALDFTAVVGRTLRSSPWFAIHMTHPPYYRDVCEDNGETCAYQMCDTTATNTERGREINNCPIEKGKYNISVTLPAPPLVHSADAMANFYTYTLDFFERDISIGCQAFFVDALALRQHDDHRKGTTDTMADFYTYTLDFFERDISIGWQAFFVDVLALRQHDDRRKGTTDTVSVGAESFANWTAHLAWLREWRRKVDTVRACAKTAAKTTRSAEIIAFVPGERPQILRLSGSAPATPQWLAFATA